MNTQPQPAVRLTAKQTFEECLRLLSDLKKNGYWPLRSPAPCSTEKKIIVALDDATVALQKAQHNHSLLYGDSADENKCPTTVIKKIS